jgi:hypothetical protein
MESAEIISILGNFLANLMEIPVLPTPVGPNNINKLLSSLLPVI